jgi:hypothetical protein
MPTAEQVLADALALPGDARAAVAHEVLLSLEEPDFDEDADGAWADEVRRRLEAIRAGQARLRDWSEVRAEIQQALTERQRS